MIPVGAGETEKQGGKESQEEHSSQQDRTNKWHDYMIIPGFCKSGTDTVIEAEQACIGKNERMGGGRGQKQTALGEVAEKGRGGTEPQLKKEASKAKKGLGGLFWGVRDAERLERSESVSKEVSGGRESMKVWEREHQTKGGHRGAPRRAGGGLGLNRKFTSSEDYLQGVPQVGARSSHPSASVFLEH